MINLKCMQVGLDPVVMDCSEAKARELWFNHVSLRERRKFEFVVKPIGVNRCEVSLQHWEDEPQRRIDDTGPSKWWSLLFLFIIIGVFCTWMV